GGATADLPLGWLDRCERFLDQLLPIITEYHTLLTTNAIFVKRTANIGVMSPEMAIDFGTSGPVLRGSGVDHDLRRDGEEIYTAMYDGYAFEVIVERDGHYPNDHKYPPVPTEAVLGDCWHRFYVRMLEVIQSIDLVRQGIDRYRSTDGSHGEPVKLNAKLSAGEVYMETEAPRGQMGFYLVSDSSAIPWRARARSSSFCNLSVTNELCRNCLIADVPAIVGSLDVVMGEIDR
ncbi:MAG: NADH-quinone oxidoreductase subunit D, partial [Aeoliella sp.]